MLFRAKLEKDCLWLYRVYLIMFAYIASNVRQMDESVGKDVEGSNRDQIFSIVPALALRKWRKYKHLRIANIWAEIWKRGTSKLCRRNAAPLTARSIWNMKMTCAIRCSWICSVVTRIQRYGMLQEIGDHCYVTTWIATQLWAYTHIEVKGRSTDCR